MKIVLAPNKDLAYQYAKDHPVEATVEAEYGEAVIPGSLATLAHHGSRAGNPAPCNDESIEPIPEDSTILISHIDLDTLGGIMALEGEKPRDAEFWRAAGYIDVAGAHHIHELSDETQDKLNAFYAYSYENRKHFAPPDKTRAVDVTAQIESYKDGVVQVLDPLHPLHEMRIDAGREWEKKAREDVENRLVQETDYIRVFSTDGPFCGAAYYSRDQDKTFPAIVSYNEKFHSISISFEDGGKDVSAQQIAKALWGPEAGGRDGIAGSPRGQEMTRKDLDQTVDFVDHLEQQLEKARQIDLANSIRYAVFAGPETWQGKTNKSIMRGFTDPDVDPVQDAVLPALEFSKEAAKEGRPGTPKFLTDPDTLTGRVMNDRNGAFNYMQLFDAVKENLRKETDEHMLEMVREEGPYKWMKDTDRPHYFADNAWIRKDTAYAQLAQHGTLQDLQKAMSSKKHPQPSADEVRPLYNVLNQPGEHTIFRNMFSDRIIDTQQAINESPVLSDSEKQALGENMVLAAQKAGIPDMHPERFIQTIQNNRDDLVALIETDPGKVYRELGKSAMNETYRQMVQAYEKTNELFNDPIAAKTDRYTRTNTKELLGDLARTDGFAPEAEEISSREEIEADAREEEAVIFDDEEEER